MLHVRKKHVRKQHVKHIIEDLVVDVKNGIVMVVGVVGVHPIPVQDIQVVLVIKNPEQYTINVSINNKK